MNRIKKYSGIVGKNQFYSGTIKNILILKVNIKTSQKFSYIMYILVDIYLYYLINS